MGTKADRCPACKYDLRKLDDPRDCPECGHFIRGPLPRGKFRLPVVSRIVSYASLVLLIPGNAFIYGHPDHRDIGELLIGASGLASMTALVATVVGMLKQPARPREPRYLWTVVFGVLGLIGTMLSQPL
jgi:hypothetical protein